MYLEYLQAAYEAVNKNKALVENNVRALGDIIGTTQHNLARLGRQVVLCKYALTGEENIEYFLAGGDKEKIQRALDKALVMIEEEEGKLIEYLLARSAGQYVLEDMR